MNTHHLATLFRVEWKVFHRAKSNYFFIFFLPLVMLFGLNYIQGTIKEKLDEASAGFDMAPLLVCTCTGLFLIYSLYMAIVGLYVGRREELVLKRLRTGEVSDATILTGGAAVYLTVTVGQILVLAAAVSVFTGSAPSAPHMALLGLVSALPLMIAMGAATAALCRTLESAAILPMPVMFVLPLITGVYFPLDFLPQMAQDVLRFMPLTGAIDLVRTGWTGELGIAEALLCLAITAAWTLLFARFAYKRFRWEPRT